MKKAILSILVFGSCSLFANVPDEMFVSLIEKAKWCEEQGHQLYEKSQDQQLPPQARKTYLNGALKFFELERNYLNDVNTYRFLNNIQVRMDDCDCDKEAMASLKQLLR